MILDEIKGTLEKLTQDKAYPFSGGVFYGLCTATSLEEWNYFVFNRTKTASENNHRYADLLEIHIVHEDYIMEDYILTVIDSLKRDVKGLTVDSIEYAYTTKGDTNMVVEIATITVRKARLA